MKRIVVLLSVAILTIAFLTGCGSNRYVVVTSDYSIHIATTKPEMDPGTNTMTFEDEQGNEISIPQGDIKQSREIR